MTNGMSTGVLIYTGMYRYTGIQVGVDSVTSITLGPCVCVILCYTVGRLYLPTCMYTCIYLFITVLCYIGSVLAEP